MNERPLLPWQCGVAFAVVGAIGGAAVALSAYLAGPVAPMAATIPLPAVWLAIAAYLSRDTDKPFRGWITTAGGYTALANAWVALLMLRPRHQWRLTPLISGEYGNDELLVLVQYPLALVMLIFAAVGWWLRRRGRLVESDAD